MSHNILESMWIQNYLAGWAQRVMVNGSCSAQRLVTCRALQESVLGPVLVNILVSDPEEVAELTVIMFAAHSKMVGAINTPGRRAVIPEALERLKERPDRTLMRVSQDKCEILHLGTNNPYTTTGWGAALRTLPCGGEQAQAEQKSVVVLAAKTASNTQGCMNRSPMATAPLYSTLPRPKL